MYICCLKNLTLILMLIVVTIFQFLGREIVQAEVPLLEDVSPKTFFLYNPHGRRDPFLPLLETKEPMTVQSIESDRLDVTQLTWKILGIMSGANGTQAVIQNARGQRYIVSSGDIVGTEPMRVSRLTPSAVTLETVSTQSRRDQDSLPDSIELRFQ